MNKKGFTLVELLATLVILGVIVGIVTVSMGDVFKNSKKKSEDVFVGTIRDALDIYLTSSNAKGLNFSTECSNKINKSFGERKVYKTAITFNDVINSEYRPLTHAELVNPATSEASCDVNATVYIYKDEDYVYYYKTYKTNFDCLLNISEGNVISNLPEGFDC